MHKYCKIKTDVTLEEPLCAIYHTQQFLKLQMLVYALRAAQQTPGCIIHLKKKKQPAALRCYCFKTALFVTCMKLGE